MRECQKSETVNKNTKEKTDTTKIVFFKKYKNSPESRWIQVYETINFFKVQNMIDIIQVKVTKNSNKY